VILLSVRQFLMLWVFTTVLMIFLGRASRGQDEAALKPQEVTGVVVDESGKPVAGVEVDTLESTLAKPAWTDDQGAFRFHQKDEEFRLLLPRGNYTVRFSYVQDKTPQIHDVAISIPLFLPPLEIKRDLILSEIPKVK
jgi:Carboxypeptidase regulatory-like domain